jgi:hypothetical protein
MKFSRRLLLLTAFAVANTAQAAATIDDTLVNATFTDGASITGSFSLNAYGYLSAVDITTVSFGSFSGYDYTLGGIQPNSPPADGINLTNANYSRTLHLVFEQPLNQSGNDLINASASWECIGYSCSASAVGDRFVASGYATPVPEPETMALFATGLLGIAGRLRALTPKMPV